MTVRTLHSLDPIEVLEEQIKKHPQLPSHLPAVLTYLKMDLILLESVSYMRQEGLWDADTSHTYSSMLLVPSATQIQALADLCPMLFLSPPSDLFNLVCRYRLYTKFQPTSLAEFLVDRGASITKRAARRNVSSRIAPKGTYYICPSAHCKRTFKKAGHTQNHVLRNHPEYLQLVPNFEPQLSTDGFHRGQ